MGLTDEELLLLNTLIYAVSEYESKNPAKVESLDQRDMQGLIECARAAVANAGSGEIVCMSDDEWEDVFAAIESNEDLMSLDLVVNKYDPETEFTSMCFADSSDQAYVVFMGTGNHKEWEDNAHGAHVSDTTAQLEAKNFIDSLQYDDIVVSGHSKGGNKAQYVTITDTEGKISRCVSLAM